MFMHPFVASIGRLGCHKNKSEAMTGLSQNIQNSAKTAAKSLNAIAKNIRVLKNLNWSASVREEFFANRCEKLPAPQYPKYKAKETTTQLSAIKDSLQGDHPILGWLRRVAVSLEQAAYLLEVTNTPEFYIQSRQIYGTPENKMLDGETKVIDLAKYLDATLSELSFEQLVQGENEEEFGADEFAKRLSSKLERYFDGEQPDIIVSEDLSAKALASSKRIRINKAAKFAPIDVRQLLHHEALVHVATALNGRAQKNFPILGRAHVGTTEVQEGLAVFAEIITGSMDPKRFRRLVDRVIAIQMAVEGADFIEVYRYFRAQKDDERQAFDDTRRVFRGGVITGGAPFTKDGVYLNGLLRVHNFMRTAIHLGRADLLRLLFVGKLDIEDIPALAVLADNGLINPPATLPPWIKDMRFLVSYLAYSGFLNRVKLPGFQDYYRQRLAEVPHVWDFGGAKK